MNHVQGCAHGCLYPCYAYLMKKRFGKIKNYDSWCEPYLVSNTLDLLDKEIPKLKNKISSVHLCFSTDPFMYEYDEISQMSIDSIKRLNSSGIKCVILTKGVLPESLKYLSDENEYGITLITLDEKYREKIEPNAAPIIKRLKALQKLHNYGKKTWISIEPYPTPNIINQDFQEILKAVSFTDKIIFGKTNYCKKVSVFSNYKEFYNQKAKETIEFCKKNNINYYIKEKTITK